jgi:HlyD family secretion protein
VALDARAVEHAELVVSVAATGTLKPLLQVDVGAEISGRIAEVFVDFNDRVHRDQPLARLDTEQLEARQQSSHASLDAARATVRQAGATVVEARRHSGRVHGLSRARSVSQGEVDRVAADLARAEAALAHAQAQQALAQAQVEADAANLAKAVIRAPIDGIVLDRRVEPGQTVASSFQTPVLFTLSSDLRAMELKVDVDEASVGDVRPGQHAVFAVAAFPGRSFAADVVSLRNAPRSVQGVVSYEAILRVDNADLVLRPGMTATAEIHVMRVPEALLVPNAALRFYPPGTPAIQRAPDPEGVPPGQTWGRVWLRDAAARRCRATCGSAPWTGGGRRCWRATWRPATRCWSTCSGPASGGTPERAARRRAAADRVRRRVPPVRQRRGLRARARRRRLRHRCRRVRRHLGPVGIGQVDDAQHHRLPRRGQPGILPLPGRAGRAAVA